VSQLEPVIGLEVHVQLRTASKLFSSAPNAFGAEPNTQTTEVDLGMPGVLPVLNARAVELAVRTALALGCDLREVSHFARKHYFYPDLPKGYQISQYEDPYAEGGAVPLGDGRSIPLVRIHMEEDAGKSIHDPAVTGGGVSHVDLNRAGVPLLEIVSEPAIHSPEDAGDYLRSLRAILRCIEASDADMEKGQLRCDANVSVRPCGATTLGVKVEVKNMNSFRSVERAIAYEIDRQTDVVLSGGKVAQETRHWDDTAGVSRPSRTKEEAGDYRYFPDPDLPPLRIDPASLPVVGATLPELPHVRRQRYVDALGLPDQIARTLSDDRRLSELFEAALSVYPNAATVANWVTRSILEICRELDVRPEDLALEPAAFARLIERVDAREVTPANARTVLLEAARSRRDPLALVREMGLESLSDAGELSGLVREVLDAHPEQVKQLAEGRVQVLNFLVGQIMRRTRGKADAATVRELIQRYLG
jgi:aspartyl-tRNA(Asn)/glutamyl-tRNA(Gln) amidotransferase subunit B